MLRFTQAVVSSKVHTNSPGNGFSNKFVSFHVKLRNFCCVLSL